MEWFYIIGPGLKEFTRWKSFECTNWNPELTIAEKSIYKKLLETKNEVGVLGKKESRSETFLIDIGVSGVGAKLECGQQRLQVELKKKEQNKNIQDNVMRQKDLKKRSRESTPGARTRNSDQDALNNEADRDNSDNIVREGNNVTKKMRIGNSTTTVDLPKGIAEMASLSITLGKKAKTMITLPDDGVTAQKYSWGECLDHVLSHLSQAFSWAGQLSEKEHDADKEEVVRLNKLYESEAEKVKDANTTNESLERELTSLKSKVGDLEGKLSDAHSEKDKLNKIIAEKIKEVESAEDYWYQVGVSVKLKKAKELFGDDYVALVDSWDKDPNLEDSSHVADVSLSLGSQTNDETMVEINKEESVVADELLTSKHKEKIWDLPWKFSNENVHWSKAHDLLQQANSELTSPEMQTMLKATTVLTKGLHSEMSSLNQDVIKQGAAVQGAVDLSMTSMKKKFSTLSKQQSALKTKVDKLSSAVTSIQHTLTTIMERLSIPHDVRKGEKVIKDKCKEDLHLKPSNKPDGDGSGMPDKIHGSYKDGGSNKAQTLIPSYSGKVQGKQQSLIVTDVGSRVEPINEDAELARKLEEEEKPEKIEETIKKDAELVKKMFEEENPGLDPVTAEKEVMKQINTGIEIVGSDKASESEKVRSDKETQAVSQGESQLALLSMVATMPKEKGIVIRESVVKAPVVHVVPVVPEHPDDTILQEREDLTEEQATMLMIDENENSSVFQDASFNQRINELRKSSNRNPRKFFELMRQSIIGAAVLVSKRNKWVITVRTEGGLTWYISMGYLSRQEVFVIEAIRLKINIEKSWLNENIKETLLKMVKEKLPEITYEPLSIKY